FPFSGSLALLGNEIFDAINIAADMVNDKGGIGGKKITFAKADAPDATAAANEANRLITQEGVKVIIGTYASGLSMAATPVAERNKVIYMETNASTDDLTRRGFKYLFRQCDTATDLGAAASKFAAEVVASKLGVDPKNLKVAVLYEDGAFGTSTGAAAKKTAESLGLQVVAYDGYKASSVDLSPIILKLKSLNPDVVIATSYINDAVLFLKQSKQLGFAPRALVGTSAGYALPEYAKMLGADAEGVFSSEAPAEVNPDSLSPEAKKVNEEFLKRWKEKKGTQPTGLAYRAFTGAWVLLAQAMPKAGAVDSEKIREAFMSLDYPLGSLANGWGVKFNGPETGNGGQNQRAFSVVMQWQNGKLVTVWPKQLANAEPVSIPIKPWDKR
ncbi:MAG: ABC transporter substrate-binding protein, partial [Actinobacteria bacterium]|nr:ABC transporter substrate-binding protein [Actinomycetota bacterium]